MNREIKFRAWVKEDSEMKGYFIPHDSHELNYSELIDVHNDNGCTILMQFTGLHDKNGTPIYEGDVVRWSAWELGSSQEKTANKITSVVEWSTKKGKWFVKSDLWDLGMYSGKEVIGNLYQNPELLTQ